MLLIIRNSGRKGIRGGHFGRPLFDRMSCHLSCHVLGASSCRVVSRHRVDSVVSLLLLFKLHHLTWGRLWGPHQRPPQWGAPVWTPIWTPNFRSEKVVCPFSVCRSVRSVSLSASTMLVQCRESLTQLKEPCLSLINCAQRCLLEVAVLIIRSPCTAVSLGGRGASYY